MAFVTDSNRPQPLGQPPPTAGLTASGTASEVPSLLMHPLTCMCGALKRPSCPPTPPPTPTVRWSAPGTWSSTPSCCSRATSSSTPPTGLRCWTRPSHRMTPRRTMRHSCPTAPIAGLCAPTPSACEWLLLLPPPPLPLLGFVTRDPLGLVRAGLPLYGFNSVMQGGP